MTSDEKVINAVIVIFMLQRYPAASYLMKPDSLNDTSCHRIKHFENCTKSLPVIDENFYLPKKSAYFIETSCTGGLKSRFACSVEAVAKTNPNWYVIVLFAGPLKTEFWTSRTFSTLNSTQNIYFYRLNTTKFAEGSPVEDIFSKDIISKSLYPVGHTSDFLKILFLYKFGGLYLDLDTIVLRSLDFLPENFIAMQDPDEIASGIMAAAKDGIGSVLTEMSVKDLAENFTLTSWGGNANDVLNRSLANICNTTDVLQMNANNCQGFDILSHKLFYPVHWRDWMLYYEPGAELPMGSNPYTHHVWNGYGAGVKLQPTTLFARLAKRYCPKIYGLYGVKFGHSPPHSGFKRGNHGQTIVLGI